MNSHDMLNGQHVASREFSPVKRAELVARARDVFVSAVSAEEQKDELIDVYDDTGLYGSIMIRDNRDNDRRTHLGISLLKHAGAEGSLVFFSLAYEATSIDRPAAQVEFDVYRNLIAEKRLSPGGTTIPIDQSNALSFVDGVFDQAVRRFGSTTT